MKTSTPALLAFVIFIVGNSQLHSANLINNGDFELGTFSGWTVTLAPSGSDLLIANLPPAHDTKGAAFGAFLSDFDSISQTFPTTPGEHYDLSFFYQVTNLNPPVAPNNHFTVLFNGVVVFDNVNANPGFGPFTFPNLLATGNATTLEFQGRNVQAFDYLDDVSVTATIAEPGSLAFLVCGFSLLMAAIRLQQMRTGEMNRESLNR